MSNFLSTEDAKKAAIPELLNKLSASRDGLSSSEAADRLLKFGSNEIPETFL